MIICTPSSGILSSDTSYSLTLLLHSYQRFHTTECLRCKQQFHQPFTLPRILPNSQLLQSRRVALRQPEGDNARCNVCKEVILDGEGGELWKRSQQGEEEKIHILIRQRTTIQMKLPKGGEGKTSRVIQELLGNGVTTGGLVVMG